MSSNTSREKYGRDSVAQIITFGTMGAKSVVRDVARVMGLSYGEGDRLAKMIPFDLKMTLEKALKQSPEFKEAYETEDVTRELIDTALILEDITRNASVHAAGVVIGDQPLVNLLPLKQDEGGSLVTQYAMGPVGDLGLLKMDFLGLKTLTVIRNTCDMVKRTLGIEIDIDHLPLDDAKTYDLLNKAETLGVFQLESGGMRDLCRKFQISSIEHITALIALYRPGPMELIPEFIKRRHGEMEIKYEHPLLEPIARETYGILIYQEQVMQAAQILAGFTLGAADILRRAMGKKNVEEMQKQREKFVKGCAEKNKIPAAKANQIFDLLEKFAGYGFNKSHAAAYAIVAYQTAYLKANHPVEFFCAMMTNDMADTAKLAQYIAEAREFGIEVLQPDVNESQMYFAPGAVVARASRPCDGNKKHMGGTPVPLPFIPFDKDRPASIYTRSLPHWQQAGAAYFVTFRLVDSLPKEVFNRWREELDVALRETAHAANASESEKREAAERISEDYHEKLERHLDEGIGACWLRNPEVSAIVENALRHFDGDRYLLGSYVIMPNHVHVLVRPAMEHKLPDILQSWKSFTAKEANKSLGRSGGFWQDESFDHIVRDEQQLQKFSRYIEENPLKAGLPEGQYRIGGDAVARASRPCDKSGGHTGETPVPLRGIRFGLAAIKGVGEGAVEAILKARKESGKFKTLSELCERVDSRSLGRKTLEALIKTGACDCFGQTRATLFAQIERTLARAASILSDKQKGQSSLFGALEEKAPPMPESHQQSARMAAARTARPRKGVARLLRHRPSAHAICADSGTIRAGEHGEAGGTAEPLAHTHRRPHRGGYAWLLEKIRQAVFDGHAGGFGRLGANPLHERELRPLPRTVEAEQGDSRRGRGQHRRRTPENFPAGNPAAGGRAETVHQTSASAVAHGAFEAGTIECRDRTRRGASRQMPAAAVFHAARRRSRFRGHERTFQRHAVAGIAAGSRRAVRRGDLLRQGGHKSTRTRAAPLGTQERKQRRGIIFCSWQQPT